MEYQQLVQPDLTVQEQAGWCLRFTERSFNAPLEYPTAWAAWQATQFKHEDRNFPNSVAVPVWFDWWGDLSNGKGKAEYGHAAFRTPDGKVHSAPGEGYGEQTFDDVDALCNYFGSGMTYVGWSEDIAGVRVVEGGDMGRIQELEDLANFRQSLLDRIGAAVSVPAPIDGNSVNQVIANINTESARITQLTEIVSSQEASSDDAKKLQAIRDALGIEGK